VTALRTPACDLFGVRYPIVQTGMGFVSGPWLTAATANAGALGILAGATMSYAELAAAIERTRELTAAPFGVNLRADAADAAGLVPPDEAARPRLLQRSGRDGRLIDVVVVAQRDAEDVRHLKAA
jgi:NAD(P)H-dependent flavin oxidoreductase YrpB (nitropropane dioxygenase family)